MHRPPDKGAPRYERGFGIALPPPYLVGDDRQLAEIDCDVLMLERGLWLLIRSDLTKEPRVRALAFGAVISRQPELHDGFHLLSPELHLMLVSLYFSVPMVREIDITQRAASVALASRATGKLPEMVDDQTLD